MPEEDFRSLTDRLDNILSKSADQADTYMNSLAEKMGNSLSRAVGKVRDAVSRAQEVVQRAVRGGGPPGGVETIDPEMVIQPIQEALGGGGVPAVDQLKEAVSAINTTVSDLAESTQVSDEQVERVEETFQSFTSEVREVQQLVIQEKISLDEAKAELEALSGTAEEQFSQIFEDMEGAEQIVQALSQVSGQFATRMTDAAQQAKGIEQIDTAGFNEIAQTFVTINDLSRDELKTLGFIESVSGQISNLWSQIKGTFVSSAGTLTTIANVLTGGFLLALSPAVDLLEDSFSAARNLREQLGVGTQRMREFREITRQSATELARFGAAPGDVVEVATSLTERFGSVQTATDLIGDDLQGIASESAALSFRLGVSMERATEIQGTFAELEMLVGGSADAAATTAIKLAEARDVAPQAVMQEITQNAEDLAMFSGNTAQSIARAAVQAQQLGVGLDSVTQFQEQSLTNITGTIQEIQKANMLIGDQLNASRLLSASYQGTEQTLAEVRRQLEGIDLQSMNFFQRRQLAEALPGFSIQEIERLARAREIFDQVGTSTSALAEQVAAGNLDVEQAIAAQGGDPIQKLTNQLNALYFVLAEEVVPVFTEFVSTVVPPLTNFLREATPLFEGLGTGIRIATSAAGELIGAVGTLIGKITSFIPLGDQVMRIMGQGLGFTLAAGATYKLITAIGGLIPSIGSLTGALGTLGAALGIGTGGAAFLIAGVVAAIGGAIAAFQNWDATVKFVRDTFNSFMSSLFGVENASRKLSNAVSAVGDWFSWLGSVLMRNPLVQVAGLGIMKTVEAIKSLTGWVSSLVSDFFDGKTAAEALGSSLGVLLTPLGIMADRIGEAIDLMSAWLNLIGDVSGAIMEGNFDELGQIILEGLMNVGAELIDAIFPDNFQALVANKMSGIASTISSYIPGSDAEVGPLSDITQRNIGGTIAQQINPEPVEQEMERTVTTARDTAAAEMEVQPAQQNVAMVDTGADQQQQQQQPQQEVRVDSDTSSMENLLRQIRDGQKNLISALKNGNIAVYLDGRKVNKEILRNVEFASG